MSECQKENKRLREVLRDIATDLESTSQQMREKAEDAIKVVPFTVEDREHPDSALLVVVKLHRDKIQSLENTLKSMINFLKIWKSREEKLGNLKIAEAIQITIDSYTIK